MATNIFFQFEEAVTEVASELVRSSDEESHTESAQVLFEWDSNAVSLRDVHSEEVSKLVKISGIAISSSSIRAKVMNRSTHF